MNKFDEEKYNAIPLAEKVQLAEDEIARLCGDDYYGDPRRWITSIPPQMDDSDLVISGAIRALEAENERLRAFVGEVRQITQSDWCDDIAQAVNEALAELEMIGNELRKMR